MGIFPFVRMPDPKQMLIELLLADPNLPAELQGKIVGDLPDTFPADLPWVEVRQAPGASARPVPQRIGQSAFDIHVYDFYDADANTLARTLAGIIQSLIGKSNTEGGFTYIEVTEPFPLPDVTRAHRWIVQALVSYRPL